MKQKRWMVLGVVAGLVLLLAVLTRSLWLPETAPRGRAPLAAGENESGPAIDFKNYTPAQGQGTTVAPTVVDMRRLKPEPNDPGAPRRAGKHIESHLSDAQYDAALQDTATLPVSKGVQGPNAASAASPSGLLGFSALDTTQCCANTGFSATVPPDPDMAVGPNHLIVVVNDAFAVFDRAGTLLSGPISYSNFWGADANGSNCTGITRADMFDPYVAYDAQADRFILGFDGFDSSAPVSRFCIAVSQTGNPVGTWNLYPFLANDNLSGSWADYPHMAVWSDAIYVTANYFTVSGNNYTGARVYAMNKSQMYAGLPASYAYHDTPLGADGTPWDTLQPAKPGWIGANLTGSEHFVSAAWCAVGSTCDKFGVFRWDNPFGANTLVLVGQAPVTTYGMPPSAVQQGSGAPTLSTGDWRMLDAKWAPDGTLYAVHHIGCNPGSGTVSCVQWAQVTKTGTLVQQGILGTNGVHRYYPSLAVDRMGNLLMAYTRSSASEYPSVVMTGRLKSDTAGTLGSETMAKAGELTYVSFQTTNPNRWGDYSGMRIDPLGGCTAFGAVEYSKNISISTKWGAWVNSAVFPTCNAVNIPALLLP